MHFHWFKSGQRPRGPHALLESEFYSSDTEGHGVNDLRSLEEDAKGHNPNQSGRLKPWPSYTYFLCQMNYSHFKPPDFG